MAIIFFDLDGTLIKGLSSEKRFFVFLLGKRMLRWRQVIEFFVFTLRWLTRSRLDIWKKNKAYLTGLGLNEIQSLGERFVTQKLLPDLRPVVKRRLDNHLARGDTVVLLTGAPDFIAGPIARHTGILHIAATVCRTNCGCFTSSPPYIHPLGAEKLRIARQMCRDHDTDLANGTAYANAASDINLLAAVSQPVAVCPDRRLRQIARQNGWEIIC